MNARTLIAIPVVVVDTVILGTAEVVASFVPGPSRIIDVLNHIWAGAIALGAGLEVEGEGLENVDRRRTYIVVSNHQSHLDTIALFLTSPVPLRMLAKKQLFRIPIFGQAMARTGHIPIDREKAGSLDWKALRKTTQSLVSAGRSLMVFAEGTRSPDGRLMPFKRGAFTLACGLGLPILPVAITGTKEVLPARKVSFHPGKARVRYLPAIEPGGRSEVELREEAWNEIARALGDEPWAEGGERASAAAG